MLVGANKNQGLRAALKQRTHEIIILKQILWAAAKNNGGVISIPKEMIIASESDNAWLKMGKNELSTNFDIIATTKEENVEKEKLVKIANPFASIEDIKQ